jgi:signal peptidase I
MRQVMHWGIFLLVILGVHLVAAPVSLGGPVSYVIVDGTSMEPTYRHGDLVVAYQRDEYWPGDVIVYDAPVDRRYDVVHRIVDDTEGGFVTQGDNMDQPDAWLVPDDVIYGGALFHIPRAGVVAELLRQPATLAAIAGIGSFGLFGARHRRRRRARHLDRRSGRRRRSTKQPDSLRGAGPVLLLLATAVVLVGGGTVFMLLYPDELMVTSERTRLEHSGTFGYTAAVTPSVVYDSATVESPPDGSPAPPIYTSLLRDLRVGFDYRLEVTTPARVEGDVSGYLRIDAGETGWTRTLSLIDADPFEGTTASVVLPVDVGAIRSLIAIAEEQTGFAPSRYQLAVVTRVDISGEADGPLDEVFLAELPMELTSTMLTVSETLNTSETVTEPEEMVVANRLELLGLSLPVSLGRTVLGAALGVLLAAGGAYGLAVRRRLGGGPVAWIRLRYGPLIVPVTTPPSQDSKPVEVTSISDLVRLARGAEQMVFHHQVSPGEHLFFVPDGAVTYECRVSTTVSPETSAWDAGSSS